MEIWIPVFVALISSLISYFASVSKGKSELKAVEIKNKSDIDRLERENDAALEKIKQEHKNEIEKMTLEMEKQAELYESNAQTDVLTQIMGKDKVADKFADVLTKEFDKAFGEFKQR